MKNKNRSIWQGLLAGLIVLAVLAAVPFSSYAAETESGQGIVVPFNSPFGGIYEWEFPYADDLFMKSSEEFSTDLAEASMGLMVSAFRKETEELDNQYETYLTGAGFTDIYAFGYDEETSAESLSGVIASRKIGDFTLIAAAPAGQGYKKEWASNMEVGDEERHVGFNKAAQIMEAQITSYIEDHQIEGRKKLWITGFSRASAVSNLTAADMIDSGLFEDVYAYLFAVPRTTRDPESYSYTGIFNICGTYDPVTQIPPESWGYQRYGIDYYTPVPEMDSMYTSLYYNCFEVSMSLMNTAFWYNPEVSYQLHLIIEFVGEMFPTSTEYAEKFQDVLMDVWRKGGEESFFLVLGQAVSQLEDLDQRQEYSTQVLVDYLTYISSQHLKQDQKQVDNGYWNPEQGIAENVMREHMTYTYIDWVFSGNDENAVYNNLGVTRRLYLYGDFDVEIYKNGSMVKGITSDGSYIWADLSDLTEFDAERVYSDVFLMRHGEQTVTCLPLDEQYEVRIRTNGTQNITYYDVICTPYLTYGVADTVYTAAVTKGEYTLDLGYLETLPKLKAAEGSIIEELELPITYSPTMIMADESKAEDHMTIGGLIALLVGVIVFVVVLLFVCLIIFIVHAIRRRKRGRPYTPWVVIIPHVLLIVVFALLTQYFTYNLYAISIARTICAGLTMLTLFLLALRGLIRNRRLACVVITAFLLLIGIVNVFLYQKSSMVSSAVWHFVIYGVILLLLCALAVSTFFIGRKKAAMDGAMPGEAA